jgi:hypothetical protein
LISIAIAVSSSFFASAVVAVLAASPIVLAAPATNELFSFDDDLGVVLVVVLIVVVVLYTLANLPERDRGCTRFLLASSSLIKNLSDRVFRVNVPFVSEYLSYIFLTAAIVILIYY